MTKKTVFGELWKLAETLLEHISDVFDWLFEPLKLSVNIPIKIPFILENGINWFWNLGITPISLLGVGLVGLVVFWLILK